jgi:hypothetical protein
LRSQGRSRGDPEFVAMLTMTGGSSCRLPVKRPQNATLLTEIEQ